MTSIIDNYQGEISLDLFLIAQSVNNFYLLADGVCLNFNSGFCHIYPNFPTEFNSNNLPNLNITQPFFDYYSEFTENVKDSINGFNQAIQVNNTYAAIDYFSNQQEQNQKNWFNSYNSSLNDVFEASKYIMCFGALVASHKFVDNKIVPLSFAALFASTAGLFTSQVDGFIGNIGRFIDDNAVKVFAVCVSYLISSALLKGLGLDQNVPPHMEGIVKVVSSFTAPLLINSYKFFEDKTEQFIMQTALFDDTKSCMEIDTKLLGDKVTNDLYYQLKTQSDSALKRAIKELIKTTTGSSIASEAGTNILKQYILGNTSLDLGIALTMVAAAKVFGKTLVKHNTDNGLTAMATGVICANIMREIVIA